MATQYDTARLHQALHSYQLLYRVDTVNYCPGCGGKHWHVGRSTAECAHCHTALPLADIAAQPTRPLFHTTRSRTAYADPLHGDMPHHHVRQYMDELRVIN